MPGADSSDAIGRSLCGDDSGRPAMRHIDYLEMMLRNGHAMAHDYSHQSTDEDPHMIAFFDSLVRRERDGWTSDEDEESISRDDDIDDHALDYHHTEQSSSDDSTSDGIWRPQSGVVFRPLRYPQAQETGSSTSDGTAPIQQSMATNGDMERNLQSGVRRRRKSRRAMLQRLGQMIPITSFVSSRSPTEDISDSTTTTAVDSSSDDSDDSESSSSSSRLSESQEPEDQTPPCDPSEIMDLCREIVDPLTLKQSRDSLSRLKRLRERALNSDDDDDSGEFSSSSPSAAKRPANSSLLPTATSASVCDNLLDGCKSPVKLNGKSESHSDSAVGVAEISRVVDFPRNNVTTDSHEDVSVSSSVYADGLAVQSSASVDQELCSILNQVPNGEAAEVQSFSAERFHSRRHQRTKSGSRRYRRTVVNAEYDHSSDED